MKKTIIFLSILSVIKVYSQEQVNEEGFGKELIRQWIHTEKQLSQEQETWKQERVHISELLELYGKELQLLNEELALVPSVEVDEERKQRLEKKMQLEDEKRRQLRKFLISLKPRVISLVKRYPEPLQTQIAETTQLLSSSKIDLSTRELLTPILSLLEAGNSFNAGVYRTSQNIVIDADEWQANVMYLGLGYAYFWVGDKAGIGTPSSDGWQWKRDDSKLAQIKKAMSVFDQSTEPQLIKLPLKVN